MGQGKLLFILLSIIVSSNASAQSSCKNLFRTEQESIFQKTANDNTLGGYFRSVLTSINSVLGDIKRPNISLLLKPTSVDTSFFMGISGEIHLGVGIEGRNRTARDIVLAHEYSHAIFQENFLVRFKGEQMTVQKLSEKAKEEIDLINHVPELAALDKEIDEIKKTIGLAKHVDKTDVAAQLEELLKVKEADLRQYTPALTQYVKLHEILIAYNELFADSLPVLLWKNPHALTEAIHKENENYLETIQEWLMNRSHNGQVLAPRDFSPVSFKNWQHEMSDKYTLLDPSRGVLWELYMRNLPLEETPIFIKTFLQAVSKHLVIRQNRGEDMAWSNKEVNLSQLNQEFVKLFVETAKSTGLKIRKTPKPQSFEMSSVENDG